MRQKGQYNKELTLSPRLQVCQAADNCNKNYSFLVRQIMKEL